MDMPCQEGSPDPAVFMFGVETAVSADSVSLQLSMSTEPGDNARMGASGLPPLMPGRQTYTAMPFVARGSSVRPTTPSENVYVVVGAQMEFEQSDEDERGRPGSSRRGA